MHCARQGSTPLRSTYLPDGSARRRRDPPERDAGRSVGLSRLQRDIRSSAQLTTISRFAQDWQGVESGPDATRDTRSMASANLNVVRSLYAEWEGGDYSSVEWAHSDIEYVVADGPSPGTWRGLAALAEHFRDWLNAWEDLRSEAEEYRELDDERVLVLVRFGGRGKTSSLELGDIAPKGAALYHVHDGTVTKLVTYFDGNQALADLGLEK